jgi:putative flippase GtrA
MDVSHRLVDNSFHSWPDGNESEASDVLWPPKLPVAAPGIVFGASSAGLRERTTSQSSVDHSVFSTHSALRDRTTSQSSVEQVELGNSSGHHRGPRPVPSRNFYRPSSKPIPLPAPPHKQAPQRVAAEPSRLRTIVTWIQSMEVPLWIIRYYRRHRNKSPSTSEGSLALDTAIPVGESRTVYWITGLDRVLFPPASCCAEEVYLMGWKPPRYLWYMISGAICDVLQLAMLYGLHFYISDSATGWALAFCASISVRHTTHRYFVFGDYVGGYRRSLQRMYMAYSVTIVLSTLLNFLLSRVLSVHVFVLALLTMAWTGVANYFILKFFWNIGKRSSASAAVDSTTSLGPIPPSPVVVSSAAATN